MTAATPAAAPPLDERALAEAMERIAGQLQSLRAEIGKVIVGQQPVVEGAVLGLLAGGHVLLEGVPGLGKTRLVRALSDAVHLDFARVQFTPDLMPSDIVGTTMLVDDEGGARRFAFQKGPVFAHILLADEINRATPKTQSALLEAMQERSVTIGGQSHTLPSPFFVMATQNPLEMEGTYPLPEAQLDRFMFKLHVPFPSRADLHEIVARTVREAETEVGAVLSGEEILEIRKLALGLPIAHHVVDFAIRLIEGSHGSLKPAERYLRAGASPRAVQALILGSKLRALVDGRANASVDDVKALAKPVMRHRVLLNFDAEADGVDTGDVVEQIVAEVSAQVGA